VITLENLIVTEGEAKEALQKIEQDILALSDARRRAQTLYDKRKQAVDDFIQNKRDLEAQRRRL
jgi:hypothetical protein